LLSFGVPPVTLAPLYIGAIRGEHLLRKKAHVLTEQVVDDAAIARTKLTAMTKFKSVIAVGTAKSRFLAKIGRKYGAAAAAAEGAPPKRRSTLKPSDA